MLDVDVGNLECANCKALPTVYDPQLAQAGVKTSCIIPEAITMGNLLIAGGGNARIQGLIKHLLHKPGPSLIRLVQEEHTTTRLRP